MLQNLKTHISSQQGHKHLPNIVSCLLLVLRPSLCCDWLKLILAWECWQSTVNDIFKNSNVIENSIRHQKLDRGLLFVILKAMFRHTLECSIYTWYMSKEVSVKKKELKKRYRWFFDLWMENWKEDTFFYALIFLGDMKVFSKNFCYFSNMRFFSVLLHFPKSENIFLPDFQHVIISLNTRFGKYND